MYPNPAATVCIEAEPKIDNTDPKKIISKITLENDNEEIAKKTRRMKRMASVEKAENLINYLKLRWLFGVETYRCL